MGTALFGSLDLTGFNCLGFVVSAVSGLPTKHSCLSTRRPHQHGHWCHSLLMGSSWWCLNGSYLTPNCMYAEHLKKTLLKFYQSINDLLQKCRHCSAEKLWLLQRLDTDKYVYIYTQELLVRVLDQSSTLSWSIIFL